MLRSVWFISFHEWTDAWNGIDCNFWTTRRLLLAFVQSTPMQLCFRAEATVADEQKAHAPAAVFAFFRSVNFSARKCMFERSSDASWGGNANFTFCMLILLSEVVSHSYQDSFWHVASFCCSCWCCRFFHCIVPSHSSTGVPKWDTCSAETSPTCGPYYSVMTGFISLLLEPRGRFCWCSRFYLPGSDCICFEKPVLLFSRVGWNAMRWNENMRRVPSCLVL